MSRESKVLQGALPTIKTIGFGLLLWLTTNFTFGDDTFNQRVDKAVETSLSLVQKSAAEYLSHRECFSCHHQSMPILAVTSAKAQGYKIDADKLAAQVEHTLKHFKQSINKYEEGKGTGGQVDTAGYGLWALQEAGIERSKFTDAVVSYLLGRDKKRTFWRRSSERPPSEASNFTATFVAALALNNYGQKHQAKEIDSRLSQVKDWALKHKAKDTEDRVFKLKLLMELEADEAVIKSLSQEILKLQNDDGGWSQLPNMKSDPYATATVLYSLKKAGRLANSDAAFVDGVEFLLQAQKDDGSWYVKSRSSPFQEYFESGFPHGKDQFISITATCWAIIVLADAKQPVTKDEP